MLYFIDTNIFLRVLIGDDQNKLKECVKLLKLVKVNKIDAYTSTIVLIEIAWTLTSFYRFSKDKVIQAVKSIINLRGLKIIDNHNIPLSLELYQKYPVKYIDTLICSNKEIVSKEAVIISYDKDFDKMKVQRLEPKEVFAQLIKNK